MKTWADFHGYILPDVIGCPIPLLDQKLIETVRDFCTRSKAMRHSETMTVGAGQTTFTFTLPTETEAVAIKSATADEEPIKVKSFEQLPPDWSTVEARQFNGLALINRAAFTVAPWLPAGASLHVVAAIRPTHEAEGVDDAFWAEHVEAIAWGVKYRLWSQPRKDWTDLNNASQARGEYETRLSSAANIRWREQGSRYVKAWG